jgi:AcrR family transcriptional regulator
LNARLDRFTLFTMNEPRERILARACDLYLAHGFDGFSMRKLADAVGVTAPALYRHYESKEAVLLEVVAEAQGSLFRTLSHALSGVTPEERFRLAGEAYLDFALANPRYFQMIHTFAQALGLREVPDALERRAASVRQFWQDRVRECIQAGILAEDDPEAIGLVLWTQGFGLISLYLTGLLNLSEDEFRSLYRASFARIVRGLGTPQFVQGMEGVIPTEPGVGSTNMPNNRSSLRAAT